VITIVKVRFNYSLALKKIMCSLNLIKMI
jgi:hypothetical protein